MFVSSRRFPRSGDRINFQHPLCRGLRFLSFFDSITPVNLGSRSGNGVPSGNPEIVQSPYGPALRVTRASSQRIDFPGLTLGTSIPVTCIVLAKVTSPPAASYGHIIGTRGAGTDGWMLQSINDAGFGYEGVRFLGNDVFAPNGIGLATDFDQWRFFAGQITTTSSTLVRHFRDYRVSGANSAALTASASPLSIGGSSASSNYATMDIAFAAVFEANLSADEIRQWMTFEWPMFHRYAEFIYNSSSYQMSAGGTADSIATINTAGPLSLSDGGITGTVSAGGSLDTTIPPSGPLLLSDNATAGTGTMSVEVPTLFVVNESAAAGSAMSIPNPLSLSDNAFAGSKATTTLNSNPGILAEGRYRG